MFLWAHLLSDTNSGEPSPVVLYGHKQNDIIGCMLGCGLAHRPYVPIDTSTPADRVSAIIQELKPELIVDFTGVLPEMGRAVFRPEDITKLLHGSIEAESDLTISPETNNDILYILFTSGSTGNPKGVQITHKNLHTYLEGIDPYFYMGDAPLVVLNSLAYSFDGSVGYLYPALYNGYTLYSVERNAFDNLNALFSELRESNINIVMTTPSVMAICASSTRFGRQVLPHMAKFISCGETLPNELARILKTRFGGLEIINTYGPTETTVVVAGLSITDEMINADRPLPVGRAFSGAKLRIAGKDGHGLPNGEQGEIQIIGEFIGAGYHNNPEMTNKVFFTEINSGEKGYRTGDIGYMENDTLYFCYRDDFQIKMHGYRIELGDIENNFLRIGRVSRVAVVPVQKDGAVQYLTAFVELSERIESTDIREISALKKELGRYIANYMIPNKIIIKDKLPINSSGKTDRKTLAAELIK